MDPEERLPGDSIAAAKRLTQSARLRAVLAVVWPVVYPALMLAGGWVLKSLQTDRQFAAVAVQLKDHGKKLDQLLLNQVTDRTKHEQHMMAIGKQTAYATAAMIATESAKTVTAKRSAGKDKAASYARLTRVEGKDPETAFAWLFPDP